MNDMARVNRPLTPLERRLELGETIISTIAFLGMFVVVTMGVFYRYALQSPLVWTVSVASGLFLWTAALGAGLPNWQDQHIQFDVLYQRFSESGNRLARIIGNIIIVVPVAWAIPATFRYIESVHSTTIPGLGISISWAFGSVCYFFIATVLHRSRLLIIDLSDATRSIRSRQRGMA